MVWQGDTHWRAHRFGGVQGGEPLATSALHPGQLSRDSRDPGVDGLIIFGPTDGSKPEKSEPRTEEHLPDLRPDVLQLRFPYPGKRLEWRRGSNDVVSYPFTEPYVDERTHLMQQLEDSVAPPEQRRHDVAVPQGLHKEVGRKLGAVLFPDPSMGSALVSATHAAYSRGVDAPTVQLIFDEETASSAQLPWELIHDGTRHLLADESIHLNRHITYFGDRASGGAVDLLRILWVSADPVSAKGSQIGKWLDPARDEIKADLESRSIASVTILPRASFEDFDNEVRRGGYHIVHFDGHGVYRGTHGELSFEGPGRSFEQVTAARFAESCKAGGVRLVTTVACQSSMLGWNESVLSGIATTLIREGVPAVVGNQFINWTGSATVATAELYASLARGESVSAAVADARRVVAKDPAARGIWFLPTLYLRLADGEGYFFSELTRQQLQELERERIEATREYHTMREKRRRQFPEGPPRQNGVPYVLPYDQVMAMEEAQRIAYLNYVASVQWSLFVSALSHAQTMALIALANPQAFGEAGQAILDGLKTVGGWIGDQVDKVFGDDRAVPKAEPAPEVRERQPEPEPGVAEDQKQEPDASRRSESLGGTINLSGSYHHWGWWDETQNVPVSPESPFYKLPREMTVQHSGDSVMVLTASPEPGQPLTFRGQLDRENYPWGDFDWTWSGMLKSTHSPTWWFIGRLELATPQFQPGQAGSWARVADLQHVWEPHGVGLSIPNLVIGGGGASTMDGERWVEGWDPKAQRRGWISWLNSVRGNLAAGARQFIDPPPSSPIITLTGIGGGSYVRVS